ncbi:MAG TPA: DUF4235 domain-containing protein [Longimicrobiaceae bacterium]|nr:DUF4235 domain-containing protein [Longimicrobiaceae bacterium]
MNLSREQKWRAVSLGSAVLAAVVVRGGIRAVWKATRDDEPPLDPLREDSSWTDAVLFSVATGLTVGLARLGARAVAASALDEGKRPHLPGWTR